MDAENKQTADLRGEAFARQCYLCECKSHIQRSGRVRDCEEMLILQCESCGLVFLDDPKRFQRPTGMYDTHSELEPEAIHREYYADDKRRLDFLESRLAGRSLLDFGSGAGGFLRLARVLASQVQGVEVETNLHKAYQEMSVPVSPGLEELQSTGATYDLITAFHVVEHLSDPAAEMSRLADLLADEGGELVIEVPSSDDALLTLYECDPFRSFTYWSQHLFLFNARTLRALAAKAGLRVRWLQHVQRYSLANHLHWLSKGLPGGHKHWHWLSDNALAHAYENRLATLGLSDTLMMGVGR